MRSGWWRSSRSKRPNLRLSRDDGTRFNRGIARGLGRDVRPVLLLASAVVFYETIFFTVLVPLLPHYEKSLGLSESEVGVLTAAYAAGAFGGAVPGGFLALRRGTRPALLVGLVLLVAGSVLFGFANSFVTLGASRFLQGIGSTFAWIGALTWLATVSPRSRRGEVIGLALGAAVAGALVGPAVGAIAERIGTEVTFALGGCLGLVVAGFALSVAPPLVQGERLSSMRRVWRSAAALAGAGLLLLSALLFGALAVLVPLRLDDFGWSAGEIAAVFLISSVLTMVVTPRIGSWSDASGPTAPIVAGLTASLLASLGLAVAGRSLTFALLGVAAGVAYNSTWVPGTALLSEGIEQVGVGLAVGFVLFNLAWTPGFLVGAVAGGWLGSAVGDSSAYVGLASLSGVALFVAAVSVTGRRAAQM